MSSKSSTSSSMLQLDLLCLSWQYHRSATYCFLSCSLCWKRDHSMLSILLPLLIAIRQEYFLWNLEKVTENPTTNQVTLEKPPIVESAQVESPPRLLEGKKAEKPEKNLYALIIISFCQFYKIYIY